MKKHLLTIENIWPMRPDSVSHATASVWFTPGYGISELWKATQRMASRPDFDKLIDCSLTTSHASASVRYDEVEETDGNSPGGQETRYHPDRRRPCWQSGLWAA